MQNWARNPLKKTINQIGNKTTNPSRHGWKISCVDVQCPKWDKRFCSHFLKSRMWKGFILSRYYLFGLYRIHTVKSPSLGDSLFLTPSPSWTFIFLLEMEISLFFSFSTYHFHLKKSKFIEFCNENALLSQQSIHKYNNKMLCIIWWVLRHYKEGKSHHFQNFSRNLNVDGQN